MILFALIFQIRFAKEKKTDHLIVGVHGYAVVNRHRGMNLPLMTLHERVLSVLGCRFIDYVVVDAPFVITAEVISSVNISEVLHGDHSEWFSLSEAYQEERSRRYAVPKEIHIIHSPDDFKFSHVLVLMLRR